MNGEEDPSPFSTDRMAAERRVYELFLAAQDLAVEAQEALVRQHARDEAEAARTLRLLELAPPPPPTVIGPYRIIGPIGQGGMGEVFEAERTQPHHQRVAIKLIKLGMDSRAIVKRFESERQALARMEHDGIARVFDAGTTDRGQPFFVMEYVHGKHLTNFCLERRSPLTERLQLVQQLCAAVTHAHQKGVVHRDLKPSNVLVIDDGSRCQVKVIDFGLAKALERPDGETRHTACLEVGTPAYMAPEQTIAAADVDTRADVYAIGVILYELLVGSVPFEFDREDGKDWDAILREEEPLRPSARLAAWHDQAASVAAERSTSTGSLQRVLRGDLDWLVLKALDKEPDRRYASASALSEQIQRFLDHEPLDVGPPSAMYRLRKLVRRYRGQVIAASAVVAASLTFGSVAWWQYGDARRSAAEARQRAGEKAAREGNFLVALAQFDEAMGASAEDDAAAVLHRAELFFAVDEPEAARRELERLPAEVPPRWRARARLLRAEWLTAEEDAQVGTAEVVAALAESEYPLTPADLEYAKALLASHPVLALDALRAARQRDPSHVLAGRMLLPLLILCGRQSEAIRLADDLQVLFPSDAKPRLIRVIAKALTGDIDQAKKWLTDAHLERADRLVAELFVDGVAALDHDVAVAARNEANQFLTAKEEPFYPSLAAYAAKLALALPQVAQAVDGRVFRLRIAPCVRTHFAGFRGAELVKSILSFARGAPDPDRVLQTLQPLLSLGRDPLFTVVRLKLGGVPWQEWDRELAPTDERLGPFAEFPPARRLGLMMGLRALHQFYLEQVVPGKADAEAFTGRLRTFADAYLSISGSTILELRVAFNAARACQMLHYSELLVTMGEEMCPADPWPPYIRGFLALEEGALVTAKRHLARSLEKDPKYERATNMLLDVDKRLKALK